MNSKPDGGPAFPVEFSTAGWHTGNVNVGMSLRDWFAGQALAGDWASQNPQSGEYGNDIAAESFVPRANLYYRMADAMLKARDA